MSTFVRCKLCGAGYDMDMEEALDDEHLSPAGKPCTTDDYGWDFEVRDEVEER